ncbi:MAG TPA: xanthine dehydrogenase family protein subunit M [Thermoanaerobaculia bacterium]|nr:xanthine dehydrogenase family protein subunit M [Thermoanaerobaculia bacterium]
MEPFEYARAADEENAIRSGGRAQAKFIAGGTNLVDLMRCTVEKPAQVIDINGLSLTRIEETTDGIRIGALVRMSDLAASAAIAGRFPAIAQALLASASPQVRNAASIGGNLMQRTRCPYFRELLFAPCNKRNPGSGCAAMKGENRMHAILGTSAACIATHPSDLAVAVAALDGVLIVRGPKSERRIDATEFHLLPGDTPHLEHDLERGELITHIVFPDAAHARRSAYLKVRDRSSFEFALASAAVGLDVSAGTIRSARVALGGVGTKPWRARLAEAALIGKQPSAALFRAAAEAELKSARGHGKNDFKIELAKRTLVRALSDLAGSAA